MRRYKKNIYKILICAIICCTSSTVEAQITFPSDVDDEAPAAPINGFIAIGFAAGAALGLRKKLRD